MTSEGEIEEYRKELGIRTWKDYLKKAAEFFYAGKAIQITGPEE